MAVRSGQKQLLRGGKSNAQITQRAITTNVGKKGSKWGHDDPGFRSNRGVSFFGRSSDRSNHGELGSVVLRGRTPAESGEPCCLILDAKFRTQPGWASTRLRFGGERNNF